jgi:prephenate dehydratase
MIIAFQGAFGAYSDLACRQLFPNSKTHPCTSFDDAFQSVINRTCDLAVIPIDNTLAGRVADVHHLLPKSGLHIIAEHFLPIRHCLLGVKGTNLSEVTEVHSHVHALPQCRDYIRESNLTPIIHADTAGSAESVAQWGDKAKSSIASELAAEIYELDILARDIQDDNSNKTRFVVLSGESKTPENTNDVMTSFMFEVKDIPAALYKALGGFATNGVNMMKLESYVDHQFNAARFYCEVSGHSESLAFQNAMTELSHFAKDIKILGCYPQSSLRQKF